MAKKRQQKESFHLENHLYLTRFIANKLGMKKISDLKDFKDVKEGFDPDGRSYMYYALISRQHNTIPNEKLIEYDDNIKTYVERLKYHREDNLTIKYYQYLALLSSEIYLDLYFQNPTELMNELNEYITQYTFADAFTPSTLRKTAYWMATGSGKTLIMHMNYWQFTKYNKGQNSFDFENIILITPTEAMTKQHLEELEKSGIPAEQFQTETTGYFTIEDNKNMIKVIDINKLKLPEDKKGQGVTIDISTLGTKNLVFVDEGHKGHKSEDKKWKQVRERLAQDGFTFEYSATFGQAITSANQDVFNEYTKAILFDYSYKYFYADGYGKDFYILNLDTKKFDESRIPILLLANAMSYYEQLLIYEQSETDVTHYNIDKPLWVFVGSRVNENESDVLEVINFLNWLLTTNENDITTHIENILKGNTGIVDADKKDVFTPKYQEKNFIHLREQKLTPQEIYQDLLKHIFYVKAGSTGRKLHLLKIKNAEGEIGLKAGNTDNCFGVINIGNRGNFLKRVEQDQTLAMEPDITGSSLFDTINNNTSSINILIGAKKFIEGWNSWRVSNMGLLNVGKKEGAQIIQLFGRGVRLRGKDFSLKRSTHLPPPHPKHIEIIETLNIFGIKANYMETFKKTIEKEDLPIYNELILKTKIMEPFPQDLQILRIKKEISFEQEELIALAREENIKIKLDLLPRATVIDSRAEQLVASTPQITAKSLKPEILDLLNWTDIYYDIIRYKNEKQWHNITITKQTLRDIIYHKNYTLYCLNEHINPQTFTSLSRVQETVTTILKKYLNRYYSLQRYNWAKENIELKPLQPNDENFLEEYKVHIMEGEDELQHHIQHNISSETIYNSKGDQFLHNAYTKQHLYQPLLIKQDNNKIKTIPMGLNQGETQFIEDVDRFITEHTTTYQDQEIYLLRNLTRGKGVGFFEKDFMFYPDFIMWIKKKHEQRIIFIDPKGLIFIGDLDHPKLKLHDLLKNEIQPKLNNPNIKLDAFIISNTSYENMKKRYQPLKRQTYEQDKHILFQYIQEGQHDSSYVGYILD